MLENPGINQELCLNEQEEPLRKAPKVSLQSLCSSLCTHMYTYIHTNVYASPYHIHRYLSKIEKQVSEALTEVLRKASNCQQSKEANCIQTNGECRQKQKHTVQVSPAGEISRKQGSRSSLDREPGR